MSHWGFWDWITYGCLGIAAFGLAIGAVGKDSPTMFEHLPAIFSSPKWAYAPIVLFALGSAILAARAAFPWLSGDGNPATSQLIKFPENYSPTSVFGKTFRNERVILDGKNFQRCTFENVTFVYNGTTPLQFSENTVRGSIRMDSDNEAVTGALMWARGFGLIPNNVNVELDPGSRIDPPQYSQPK